MSADSQTSNTGCNALKRPADDGSYPDVRGCSQTLTTGSPKKKCSGELHGYIDGTTKIFLAKSGKTHYFKFDIVSEDETCTVVCFDKQRHQEILNEDNANIIYKFKHLSYKNGDYMMEASTKWKKATKYKYTKCLKITDVVDMASKQKIYSRVHVIGILYNLSKINPTRDGIQRRVAILQDASGLFRCMIYGNIEISEDIPYRINYLHLTLHKGRRILATTYETKFSQDLDGVDFPKELVLSLSRNDVGIQKHVGDIGRFSKDINKNLCPDCRQETRKFEDNEYTTSCDNSDCDTDILTADDLLVINFICFRFKFHEVNKYTNDPLMECPSNLLDKLLGITKAYCKEVSHEYKKLIGKRVELTYDTDDFEVIDIKFI